MNVSFFIRLLIGLISFSSSLCAVYELSICAIFQDEAPYFREWIEFHKLQGVRHFYLYNNNSEDHYLEVLQPYIASGEVTLTDWPYTHEYGDHDRWIQIQTGAYMDCIKKYGTKTKWLAAIDIDEFLFCPNGEKLPEFLKKYKSFGGLCVNWIKFGTSNLEDILPGFCLIECLIQCSIPDHNENLFVKSIVQPSAVKACPSPHYFAYKKHKYAVDVNGQKINGMYSKHPWTDKIRINHYWTRTIKYFLEKKIGGRRERRPQFTIERILKMAESYNQIVDTAILRYVEPLREALGYD